MNMNNIDKQTLVDYIKSKYPKIIFNSIKLRNGESKNDVDTLGFVISNNKLIIGYINIDGTLCKLIEPIDLNNLSHGEFIKIINNLPIVKNKDQLLKLFDSHDDSQELKMVKMKLSDITYKYNDVSSKYDDVSSKYDDVSNKYSSIKLKYDVLLDDNNKDVILIKKEYSEKIDEIKLEYESDINKLKEQIIMQESCKDKLLNEKDQIINSIKIFREQVSEYINEVVKSKNFNNEELNESYLKLLKEKTEVEDAMLMLKENVKNNIDKLNNNDDIISDFSYKLKNKEDENVKLNKTIRDIQEELKKVEDKFNEKSLENVVLQGFNKKCIDVLLNEKETIIEKIKEYKSKWLEWANTNRLDIQDQKSKLKNELDIILVNLKKVINGKDEYIKNLNLSLKEKKILINKLNNNISDIKHEVNKSLNDQLLELSKKNQELQKVNNEDSDVIKDKNDIINELTKKLEQAKSLLDKNASINIIKEIDYVSCYATLQKFMNVNNMFYRKKEIISILDNIINNEDKMTAFNNLTYSMKSNIKDKFEQVKNGINNHIDFLDLNKYIESPTIKLFKSKSTIKNVPSEFCDELNNISSYWDNNIGIFREQDKILTNIYEDLSGAVRVYIKIKPLLGVEQKSKTVYIENNTKSVTVDCSHVENVNKKETYGDFYGVFDDTFTNKDVYTGINGSGDISELDIDTNNIDENPDTVSPGLYSTFKQVEDGYSIVLFGYGSSGTGKTFSLLGDKTTPGLLHYGLNNLEGVKNIKLKYLFEQYIDKFVPTINKIRGKIINLIREVPQLRNYSIDETKEFQEYLNNKVNVNNLHINDINILTSILEEYRKKHFRIKKTPNNPVSSRSHLYMVYEIEFDNNKTGYITIVDTAGRESPTDIYNMFIDTSQRINLTTILGPTGGAGIVNKYMKPEYSEYDSVDVFNILKEGFYINETINHLIYFFNKKNYKNTKIVAQTNLDKYSNDRYYVNPKFEEDSIDPINNCLMVPILKFLDVISNRKKDENDYKPTKFIALVGVRKEENYCNQIFSSLEFASRVKSS
jgi:hypothetical protein